MKLKKKEVIGIFILFLLIFTSTLTSVFPLLANNNNSNVIDTTTDSEHDVDINIPIEENGSHNILFVFDASTGNNTSWVTLRKSIIEAVDVFLPYDDSTKNINKVGMISYGISEVINIPLTSDKSQFNNLPEKNRTQLLAPGRTSSNSEVGLKAAKEYIQSLSEQDARDKNHTLVIYMSDGESNMSEEKFDWYQIVKSGVKYGSITVEAYSQNIILSTICSIAENPSIERIELLDEAIADVKNLYKAEINSSPSEDITLQQMVNEIGSDNTKLRAILSETLDKLYTYIGYDFNQLYSAGEVENMFKYKMFVSDQNMLSSFQNIFYVALLSVKYDRTECTNRAIEEGNRLKAVANIHTLALTSGTTLTKDLAKKLMDPDYEGNDNEEHFSSGFYFSNINKVDNKMNEITVELTYTEYQNLTVTNYTSKWVIPVDSNGDGLFNEKDITVSNGDVEIENPIITVEKLSQEEINNSTNLEIQGNASDYIYKITWNVPEKLKKWDVFKINYKVEIDANEPGVLPGNEYNTSADTSIVADKYEKNENGEDVVVEQTKHDIALPSVKNNVPTSIKIRYVDKETNEEISLAVTLNGFVTDSYTTEAKQIPYYRYLEEFKPYNKDGVFDAINQDIIFYYEKLPFNLSIKNELTQVLLNGKEIEIQDGKLAELEIKEDEKENTEMIVKNKIIVKNTGEVEGEATLLHNIPEGYEMGEGNAAYWTELENGDLSTQVELQPNEETEFELILRWKKENIVTMVSKAELTKTKSPLMAEDMNINDNSSEVTVITVSSVPTNVNVRYLEKGTNKEIIPSETVKGYVNKIYSTKSKEIEYYKYLEELQPDNMNGIFKSSNEDIIYYYEKLPFNISVENKLTQLVLNGQDIKIKKDGKLAKIEIKEKDKQTSEIIVKSKIKVKNTGEIAGKAELLQNIPDAFEIAIDNPEYWTKLENGNLAIEIELQPKEEKELELILKWKKEKFGKMLNHIEIVKTENLASFEDMNLQDNKSDISVIVGIATGKEIIKFSSAIILLAVSAYIIILKIKKR